MNVSFFRGCHTLAAALVLLYGGVARAETTFADLNDITSESEAPLRHKKIGTVGFDSSSFFYTSKSRSTSSTTFEANLNRHFDTRTFHGEGNLQVFTFVAKNPDIGVESRELYLSTQYGLLPEQEVTVGRRYYEWSKVDKTWDMMSLWSPRFTWDPIHPETIGMTGFFYNWDHDGGKNGGHFQLLAFASPIAIPERGTSTKEQNGDIVSSNPLWNPLPRTVTILNNPTQVHYSLNTPPLQNILFRPNFAVKARYETEQGYWGSLGDGVLPIHMVQLAAEPFVDTSPTGNGDLNVAIRPQFPMRNITTLELGYDSPAKDWDIWASGSHEVPFQFQNQSNWLNPIITPANVISAGTDVKLTSNFWFSGSALFVHEEPFNHASDLPNVNIELPSRFPLKQGIRLGGKLQMGEATQSNMAWTQDLLQQSHLVSLDVEHTFRRANVIVGGGADVFVDNTAKGWLGQYYGDDRLRGWLKYAF